MNCICISLDHLLAQGPSAVRQVLSCRNLAFCSRCTTPIRTDTPCQGRGHCMMGGTRLNCVGWSNRDFSNTPVSDLPTKETYEDLGADYYFQPEFDTIVLLNSETSPITFPHDEYYEYSDESKTQDLRIAASRLPLCPRCRKDGRCSVAGDIFTCATRNFGERL